MAPPLHAGASGTIFVGGRTLNFSSIEDVARKHRFIDNESGIVELTSRCVQGRYLMRPSSVANDRILGIIGRAQRLTGIRLYSFTYMSNHSHTLAGAGDVEQMAAYKRFVNGNIARELGREIDWREKFWGRRYHSASLADDEEDQQRRLRYILTNGCKEGLVDSPLDWPGVSTAWALSRGVRTLEGTWLDRSSKRSAPGRRGPLEVKETVRLTPMPFMADWTPSEQQRWFREIIREIEDETRDRHGRNETRSLGVRRVERQHPHDRPADFHPRPGPLFHATSPEERRKLEYAREMKEAAYCDAAERLRRGELDVEFPEDCFPPPLPHATQKRGPPVPPKPNP